MRCSFVVRAIKVPKKDAESVRSETVAKGVLDRGFRIRSEGDIVYIPVTEAVEGYEEVDIDLERMDTKETDYRNLVKVSDDLRDILPSSFDVIGDVVVIKIPEQLIDLKNDIGKAIMDVTANARVVMMDSGVKGDLRIRTLERIAGTGTSETVHKEFGVRISVDPSKIYFNPRLATERMRIASQVNDGETIIDMFSGAAPFPLVISKHSHPSDIYAIDLNSDALEFMVRNIEMNRSVNIHPMQGNAQEIVKDLPKADRIIMNLPQSAIDFLEDALHASKKGAVIHLYRIMERDASDDIVEMARSLGHNVAIKEKIELKTYSPTMSVYVFDLINEGPI